MESQRRVMCAMGEKAAIGVNHTSDCKSYAVLQVMRCAVGCWVYYAVHFFLQLGYGFTFVVVYDCEIFNKGGITCIVTLSWGSQTQH